LALRPECNYSTPAPNSPNYSITQLLNTGTEFPNTGTEFPNTGTEFPPRHSSTGRENVQSDNVLKYLLWIEVHDDTK